MKGTRLGVGLANRFLSSIGPGSDKPLFSSASHHDPFRPNRSSDPLDAVVWTRAAGRLRQRRLVSQRAKTGEKT
jgi:hypothetical protein